MKTLNYFTIGLLLAASLNLMAADQSSKAEKRIQKKAKRELIKSINKQFDIITVEKLTSDQKEATVEIIFGVDKNKNVQPIKILGGSPELNKYVINKLEESKLQTSDEIESKMYRTKIRFVVL